MFDNEARMTFTEHLAELRTRIVRSAGAIVVCVLLCYALLSGRIVDFVRGPLLEKAVATQEGTGPGDEPQEPRAEEEDAPQWVTLTPIEAFLVRLKLSAYGGFLFALPIVLYQVIAFIFPGLKPKEKKLTITLLFGCSFLAILGMTVAYAGILPLVLPYLMGWGQGDVKPLLQLSATISLLLKFYAGFAIAFQFPMVVLVLVYLGLLTPDTLAKYRRYAIVFLAFASAALTPPDPLSMIMMGLPLVLLYEISILLARLVVRQKKKQAAV